MITKAIVESVLSPYSAKVRIPMYDGIESTKNSVKSTDLSNATICTFSSSVGTISEGDIVFVSFEDDDIGKPVILGLLCKEDNNASGTLSINDLNVNGRTNLSSDTTIGNITSAELSCLVGVKQNIQMQINSINTDYTDLKDELNAKIATKLTGTKFSRSGQTPNFDTYIPYTETLGENTSPEYVATFINNNGTNGLTYSSIANLKVKMQLPDYGNWSISNDSSGNLIFQRRS